MKWLQSVRERLRQRLAASREYRDNNALQLDLEELENLYKRDTQALKQRIEELETQVRMLTSDVTVSKHEAQLLSDIIERDRKRVEAEMAGFIAQVHKQQR